MLLGTYESVVKRFHTEVVYAHNPYTNELRYCGLPETAISRQSIEDISIYNIIGELKEAVVFGKHGSNVEDSLNKSVYQVFSKPNIISGDIGEETFITIYDFPELGLKNIQEKRYTDDDLFAYIIEVETNIDEDLILVNQSVELHDDDTFEIGYLGVNYLTPNLKTGLLDLTDDIFNLNYTKELIESLTSDNSAQASEMVADLKNLIAFRLYSSENLNQDDEDVELLEESFEEFFSLDNFSEEPSKAILYDLDFE